MIIAPVVVELKHCGTMGVIHSDLLGKFEGLLIIVEFVSACFVFSLSF